MIVKSYLLLLCIFLINIASNRSQFFANVDPQHPEAVCSFVLYNKTEIVRVQNLKDGDGISNLAPDLGNCGNISFYFFGFTTTLDDVTTKTIINAYATNDSNCLIVLDWAKAAGTKLADYPIVAKNVEEIAIKIASIFLNAFVNGIIPLEKVILVGWSIGAHMAGKIGRELYAKSGDKKLRILRIVALDPAGPLYCCKEILFGALCHQSLVDTDAEFVMSIHSDSLGFGSLLIAAHMDVYPNGGHAPQPGNDTVKPTGQGTYSHRFSVYFWADAVIYAYTVKQYVGVEIRGFGVYTGWYKFNRGGTVLVGPETPTTTRGTFYLNTNAVSPYSKGQNGIERSPDIFTYPIKLLFLPLTIVGDMVNLTGVVTC